MNGDPRVRAAVDAFDSHELYFSVITIGEIAKGVELLSPGRRRAALEVWLQEIEVEHGDRIVPVTLEVARRWGEQAARNAREGLVAADADGLIAATAGVFGMPVMTRNVRHFQQAGVDVLNPWEN